MSAPKRINDRTLGLVSVLLGAIGLGAAGYLLYTKLTEEGVCGVSHGCTVVQTSHWSEVFSVPVSAYGVGAYITILLILLSVFVLKKRSWDELSRIILVAITGFGFLFSCFLMYTAYFVLEAFCPFCTTSAICMTLLFVISTVRFLRGAPLEAAQSFGAENVD